MKNYGKLIPIIMVVLMTLSAFSLFSESVKTEKAFQSYLEVAREKKDVGIVTLAVENYQKALEIKDEPDIYVEVAEMYASQNKMRKYLDWCENFFDTHSTEPKAYDCILKAYFTDKDYESCYDIIYTAEKRNIKTDYLSEISQKIHYYYEIDHTSYENVSIFSSNFSAVQNKGVWGFVNRYGVKRVGCQYPEVGVFTQAGCAPVKTEKGEVFFIDKEGNKTLATNDKYLWFGPLTNNTIVAQKSNKKYTYLNSEFDKLFGEYDYASAMNNDIAVIRSGDVWTIINSEGETTSKDAFDSFILDEKNIACRNERLFAHNHKNQVIMVDAKGQKIGTQVFQDAQIFFDETYAAVKIKGKWGFVDKNGEIVIKPKYDDARSFSNGLAAVKISDKWGFIDTSGNLCIEAKFYETKDFNEKGSCFVKVGEQWQLLKLYRLNREE